MQAITPQNLPKKFFSYLIGNPSCNRPSLKEEINQLFQGKPLLSLKGDYILEEGNWVLKLPRKDGLLTTPDTHLYRVRKAEKVRQYIEKNGLQQHLAVPQKYLYWHERQFYVVCEKLQLSENVPSIVYPEMSEKFSDLNNATLFGGPNISLCTK